MEIEKLIEELRWWAGHCDRTNFGCQTGKVLEEAATALSSLQGENEEMQKQLNMFSEFLCYMTGGLLSKTNYTAQEMVTAAEDYQQKVCGECDLRVENEKLLAENIRWGQVASEQDKHLDKLRVELEQVKAERDAAVEDLSGQCEYCLKRDECVSRKGPHWSCWEWRGPVKED